MEEFQLMGKLDRFWEVPIRPIQGNVEVLALFKCQPKPRVYLSTVKQNRVRKNETRVKMDQFQRMGTYG
jgi:hypothetical protein